MDYVRLALGILVLGSFAWSWSKMGGIMDYWINQSKSGGND